MGERRQEGTQAAPACKEKVEEERVEKKARGHRGGQHQDQGREPPQTVRRRDVRKEGRVKGQQWKSQKCLLDLGTGVGRGVGGKVL